tara:strand:+ start:350 stop:3616 length:3267 start_codon:yes stop_codon:yes gene_type:complete
MILKNKNSLFLIISMILIGTILSLNAKGNINFLNKYSLINDSLNNYNALEFRSIGPALMSGRISDIVINPNNENEWIVATGSGGVWKTTNAGTTWNPIFDNENSFSIGCLALDPNNPKIIWVGTGENVGGRHVSLGDGIYRSVDGGETWNNMGLNESEHISKIIVDKKNSNNVLVAAQGPLWSKGGQRGLYKSVDGGNTWKKTLGDNEWVGATDVIQDYSNPDILYAATWQRHRTVAGYMGGGPGTAIYKSTDLGDTWVKLTNGLPSSNMGKIGLGISFHNPQIIYAAIELDRRRGGFFRSNDGGQNWIKMSDAVSGGTGPHYYQELYVSPHNFDEVYLADNYMQVSYDGGKNFSRMNESEKHVDNHAVAFKKNDKNYILVGCDGGLYESFDKTKNWKFVNNMPITQFYKIAVDDAYPFYNVYGGTQDNNTQGGPSRTDNLHGIRNSDWFVVLGGDGHQPATEPGNPNIVYSQWQRGNLNRHNRITGENINIKPHPEIGEKSERFNWDAPIIVSPHKNERIYFASQRVWKSEDRGDSWTPISPDLTKNIERISTKFYDKHQNWENAWDIYAMSNYSTITSLSESSIKEGLIYVGTDDGVIQVTEDGGSNWRKVNFNKISGLPTTSFVNDIKADLFDENKVIAVFDNHKYGDYNPYLFFSNDKGKTWKNISPKLPKNTFLWRIVQDHIDEKLFFLGTEFGVYFSNDGTKSWYKLNGGLPNISVRDLAIQKRENDLVLGTFGRGIYILDDYSCLREFKNLEISNEAVLFDSRNTHWYIQNRVLGSTKKASQGDNFFVADNPPFGTIFTYYLSEKYLSLQEKRIKEEKKNNQKPIWSKIEIELNEISPSVWIFIYSKENEIIRKIKAKNNQGFNRISWDLKSDAHYLITDKNISDNISGNMVKPDKYHAQLYKKINGKFYPISNKIEFNVKALSSHIDNSQNIDRVVDYWENIERLKRNLYELSDKIDVSHLNVNKLLKAYSLSAKIDSSIERKILEIRNELNELNEKFNGSKSKKEIGEQNEYPTIWSFLWSASGSSSSTYGPTDTQLKSLQNTKILYQQYKNQLLKIDSKIISVNKNLKKINAPTINVR